MKTAIALWFDLYFSDNQTTDEDRSQRLPYVVVNKLYKASFGEYKTIVDGKGEKAVFMSDTLLRLNKVRKKAMQLALVGGECMIKPIIAGRKIDFAVVRRDCYLVLGRDALGSPTSVGCAEYSTQGNFYYSLLEKRTIGQDGLLTIESRLFRSTSRETLGSPMPLAAISRYEDLSPIMTLPKPCGLGLALCKTPMENCVDGSADGVSVYAAATRLIQNINRNEQQMSDEFENGASRVIVSKDMVEKGSDGKHKLADKLFVGIDDNQEDVGITIFSPDLREQSYLNRKAEYLRNIETQIGLKRGILSDVEATERTATEVTSSAGDYNLTIIDFQQMWESTVRETLGICDALGQMYKLCGSQHFDPAEMVTIDWGDGVLFDRTRTWNEYKDMVAAGLLKPEIALGWYFEQPCETAEDLAAIRTKYMPEMDALLGGE